MRHLFASIALFFALALAAQTSGTVVSGTVLDADDSPVANTRVSLARYLYTQGRLQIIDFATATTDDRGLFRLTNINPGPVFLRATPPIVRIPSGPNVISGKSVQANLPTESSLTVTTEPIPNLTIRLPQGPRYTVRGSFRGPTTDSVKLTTANLGHPDDPSAADVSILGPKGFEFTIPPGDYVLTASFLSPFGSTRQLAFIGRTRISVSGNLEGVVIPLSAPVKLTGKLITQEGPVAPQGNSPASSGPSRGVPGQQSLTGPTVALAFTAPHSPIAPHVTMNKNATFQIDGIEPGRYIVEVGGTPGFIQSVHLNGRDATGQPLDLTSLSAPGTLDIEISTGSGALDPIAPPKFPDAPRPITYVWPVTPDLASSYGGVFMLPTGFGPEGSLKPGEYYAAIFEENPRDFARIPSFLARFNSIATRVTIRAGETTKVTPTVISATASRAAIASFK